MESMHPSNQARFLDSFRAAARNIADGLSASQAASTDRHWKK